EVGTDDQRLGLALLVQRQQLQLLGEVEHLILVDLLGTGKRKKNVGQEVDLFVLQELHVGVGVKQRVLDGQGNTLSADLGRLKLGKHQELLQRHHVVVLLLGNKELTALGEPQHVSKEVGQ